MIDYRLVIFGSLIDVCTLNKVSSNLKFMMGRYVSRRVYQNEELETFRIPLPLPRREPKEKLKARRKRLLRVGRQQDTSLNYRETQSRWPTFGLKHIILLPAHFNSITHIHQHQATYLAVAALYLHSGGLKSHPRANILAKAIFHRLHHTTHQVCFLYKLSFFLVFQPLHTGCLSKMYHVLFIFMFCY